MRVSGALLVFVGFLLLTGEFTRLAGLAAGLHAGFPAERI